MGNGKATGAIASETVTLPGISFIQNSLTELPENPINTDGISIPFSLFNYRYLRKVKPFDPLQCHLALKGSFPSNPPR